MGSEHIIWSVDGKHTSGVLAWPWGRAVDAWDKAKTPGAHPLMCCSLALHQRRCISSVKTWRLTMGDGIACLRQRADHDTYMPKLIHRATADGERLDLNRHFL